METKKATIEGYTVWVTIMRPVAEVDGKPVDAPRYIVYYSFYEPVSGCYGKLLCGITFSAPVVCEDMAEAIGRVEEQLMGLRNNMVKERTKKIRLF